MNMWKSLLLLPALVLTGLQPAGAQDAETIAAAKQFSHDPAIMWDHSEHVTFRFEDDKLTAKSTINQEVLLLSEQAASFYNTRYVYHSFFHTLDKLQAASLVPDGNGYRTIKTNEFRTTHSEGGNIFYDDGKQTAVTFSSLAKYARTRLSYTLLHPDVHFLPAFYFQSGMPIRNAEFKVTVPKGVKLGYIMQGEHREWVKQTTDEGRNETTYTWVARNVPKMAAYSDGPEAPYYVPHLLIYVASYTPPHSDTAVAGLSTVDDLYRFYYPFIKNVNKKADDSLSGLVASVTEGAATDREKAASIYRWVQQHIKYVAFEDGMGGFIPRPASAVCSRRFGDCKDMTSLLVAMCRAAGLNAYFTWIGTRDKPYRYEEVPLPVVDDHMICTVKLGDEWIFMDGTDAVIPFGIPPYHIQGKEALVGIDAKTYKILPVPELEAAKNTVVDSTYLTLAGNRLSGKVNIACGGYGAWRMAGMMMYRNETEKEKALRELTTRGSNKYILKGFNYKAAPTPEKSCVLQSDFELADYAKNVSGEWYINLNLQRTYEDDFANKEERRVPIEHNFKQRTRQVVVLDIPKGYHVSYLPPGKEEKVPGLWGYKISYQQTGSQVKLIKDYELNTLHILPKQFADHDRLVEALREQYKESIVLTAN